MNLNRELPGWVGVIMRIIVYGAMAYAIFMVFFGPLINTNILGFNKHSREVNACFHDMALQVYVRSGAQKHRNLVQRCLHGRGVAFDDLDMELSGIYLRLPSNPEKFAGNWKMKKENCEFNATLKNNGYYRLEPNGCASGTGAFEGIWAVLDNKMYWIPVPGTADQIDSDKIASMKKEAFELVEDNGVNTRFSRVDNFMPARAVKPKIAKTAQKPAGKPLKETIVTTMPAVKPSTPPRPPTGRLVTVSGSDELLWRDEHGKIVLWNPSTGGLTTLPLDPVNYWVNLSGVATQHGLVLFVTHMKNLVPKRTEVVVLSRDFEQVLRTDLKTPRIEARVVVLKDQSVLIAGGTVWQRRADSGNKKKKRTNSVEHVYRSGEALASNELSPVPGEILRHFSLVALADGRAMLLGGSNSQFTGNGMIDETWFLDVGGNTWQPGPRMLEARSGASATLMPDNSVLVVGGWTPQHTWNDGPSRTSERWNPQSNRFEPDRQLPVGIANHRAMRITKQKQNALLVSGGWLGAWKTNSSVLVKDLDRGSWYLAKDRCVTNFKVPGMTAVAFEFNDDLYTWCQSKKSEEMTWKLVSLSHEAESNRIDSVYGLATGRRGMGFLAPRDDAPGLMAGGALSGKDTAAVEVVWADGRLQPITPLNHARRYARVFRLKDGSFLVAGGLAGHSRLRAENAVPMEILPAGQPLGSAQWISIDFDVSDAVAFGALKDGSLLVLNANGKVKRLMISIRDGKPVVEAYAFPSLNHQRITSLEQHESEITIRELADGRIIIAGGNVRHHRMALLHNEIMTEGAADTYVDMGEFAPARYYDIYDPVSGSWSKSVLSDGAGATTAILGDGRVLKWGTARSGDYWENRGNYYSEESARVVFDISQADGKGWKPFSSRVPPRVAVDAAYPSPELFVTQGELFLFGKRVRSTGERRRSGKPILQWFDSDHDRWLSIWESGPEDNWYRKHEGRVVTYELPNGKRVVVPVAGLSGRGNGA